MSLKLKAIVVVAQWPRLMLRVCFEVRVKDQTQVMTTRRVKQSCGAVLQAEDARAIPAVDRQEY